MERKLTVQCGIIDLFEHGDSIMLDRGFQIVDLLAVGFNIPPSKVDRRFTLKEQLAGSSSTSIPNCMAGIADRIFYVCTVLTNFSKPLV